jgi:hypothetical protein
MWGIANSRMKDFYDIWMLASSHTFEMDPVARTIRGTFGRRRTGLQLPVAGLNLALKWRRNFGSSTISKPRKSCLCALTSRIASTT